MSNQNVEGTRLVPVYRAPTETVAEIVRGLVESEGIPTTLKSVQVPWCNGIMVMGQGYWGDLLVPECEADRAREIIRAYEDGG
jgi:hypothetical protein